MYGPAEPYRFRESGATAGNERIGYPGEYPYTRGIQPNMYRGRLWTMRQYAGWAPRRKQINATSTCSGRAQPAFRWRSTCRHRSATTRDDPMSLGEVGKVGVAIDSLEDMERLFAGIPLDKITTSMTINATAGILLALYLAVARSKTSPDTTNFRHSAERISRNTSRAARTSTRPNLPCASSPTSWTRREVPGWNTITIGGYHMREAGCTAAQEIAFTLADGITYVQAAMTPA